MVLTFGLVCFFFFKSDFSLISPPIHFQTKCAEFKFSCIPSKGRDYKMMERQFEKFKIKHPDSKDKKLYRITSKNYLNIGKWTEYKTRVEWQYPYLVFWKR